MNDCVATMSVLPLVGARSRRFALEATRRGLGRGMGDSSGGGEATTADKKRLSALARQIFDSSRTAGRDGTIDMLRGQIQGGFSELSDYAPWTDSGWFGSYDSSQVVRQNLQMALENVNIVEGRTSVRTVETPQGVTTTRGEDVSPSWRPQEERGRDVNVWAETAGEIPGEVMNAAKCAAKGMRYDGEKCVPITDWEKWKKILLAVAAGLIVIGAGYVAYTNSRGRGQQANPRSPRSNSPRRTRPRGYFVAKRGGAP